MTSTTTTPPQIVVIRQRQKQRKRYRREENHIEAVEDPPVFEFFSNGLLNSDGLWHLLENAFNIYYSDFLLRKCCGSHYRTA